MRLRSFFWWRVRLGIMFVRVPEFGCHCWLWVFGGWLEAYAAAAAISFGILTRL
jgi:hypothetical protein